MNLNIQRESYTDAPAWLASHRGAMYKAGGITLSRAAKDPDPATGRRIYRSGEFVGRISPLASGLFGTYGGPVKASLTTALLGANNDAVYTARAAGVGGNAITIAYVDPGAPNGALSAVAAGNAITVTLATNAAGVITSTVADVITAVNTSATASLLVYGELARNNNGTGVVIAMAATNLAGGAAVTDVSLAAGQFGILMHDVDVTDGDGMGGLLYGGKVLSARLPVAPVAAVVAALPHVMFTTENA